MLFPKVIVVAMLAAAVSTAKAQAQPKVGAVELDVPYARGGDQQKLDLYLPNHKNFATVVFTFGGGWHRGGRKAVTPIGKKLQSLGYGCALLSHRLAPQHKFPAQIEDVATAFAWVKQNIGKKGGDPRRVFLIGHSSGAHLSLLLATDARYLARHKLSPADIAGVA
jgi:acetyl esterase/lipase